MEFECSVEINAPVGVVQGLFENPENFKYWQDGFIKAEHLSGEKGTVGSKTNYFYKIGKRELTLTETIITNKLPKEFKALFESDPMDNELICSIEEINDDQSFLSYRVIYTRFGGFMPMLMAKLFPGMFKKQTQKWLDQFKEFVESKHP